MGRHGIKGPVLHKPVFIAQKGSVHLFLNLVLAERAIEDGDLVY